MRKIEDFLFIENRILLRQLSSVEEEEHHFLQRMLVVLRPFKVKNEL
jgi:hypothetical protein